MEHCEIWFLRALCIMRALFLQQPVLLHFTPQFFVTFFLFLSILTLVIAFVLVFFGNFIYTEHLYKPQSVQTKLHLTFGNRRGRQFRCCFLLFPFSFIFFLPFSATKHSSEDDNSEDGWLDLFLLEEEGYWTLDLR